MKELYKTEDLSVHILLIENQNLLSSFCQNVSREAPDEMKHIAERQNIYILKLN